MNSIRFNLSALWRSLRLFVAACVCVLMLVSNTAPAYSFPNPFAPKPSQASDPTTGEKASDPTKGEKASDPTKGEDKLQGIEEGAQKTITREQDLLSGEKVIEKSNEGGLNEVQGAADIEKMKSPSNSQSESVEGIVQEKLEEAAGK